MEQKLLIKSSIDVCKVKLNILQDHTFKAKENSLIWFQDFCNSLVEVIVLYTKYSTSFKQQEGFRNSVLLHVVNLKEILSLLIEIFTMENETKIVLTEARNFVAKQLIWCLDGLLHNLNNTMDSDSEESFVQWMDLALDKLLEFNFSDGRECVVNVLNEFRSIVEEVLSHALSVAQIATEQYSMIKGSCQSVLEAVESLEKEIAKNEWNLAMCTLFVDVCNDKLCLLERRINITVLKLCANIFSDYKTPLEKLHKYCLSETEKTEAEIDNIVAEFDLHVDKLVQIGFFAVTCSTDISRVTQIKNCLVSLEALEVELVPALTAITLEKSPKNLHYASVLKKFWIKQAKTLQNAVYFIIDPTAFSNVVYEELKSDITEIETSTLSEADVAPILAKTRVLIDFFQISSEDMTQEELLKVKAKLEKVTIAFNELNSAVGKLLGDNNSQKRIIKRCKIVSSLVKQLWLSTSEEKEDSINNIVSHPEASRKFVGNRLIDHCIEKGQEILKDRSILKHSATNKTKYILLSLNKGKQKETPLLRLVLQKRMNFTNSRIKDDAGFDRSITNLINDVSKMTRTLESN